MKAHTYPKLFEIRSDYIDAFHKYLKNKWKKRKRPRFKSIKPLHINYMKTIMENVKTRDLSIDKKLLLMKLEFP